jgi:hypothetical protein
MYEIKMGTKKNKRNAEKNNLYRTPPKNRLVVQYLPIKVNLSSKLEVF